MARTAIWTPDTGGDVLELHDWDDWREGYIVLGEDFTGLQLPVYEHTSDIIPGVPGERWRSTRVAARPISLPMHIYATDRDTYRARARRLCAAFAPDGGRMGVLSMIEADGQERRMRAIYNAGLEGVEGGSNGGENWWTFVISLTAYDPFWYAPDPVTVDLEYAAPIEFFPHMQLSSSQVLGGLSLYNEGDVPAYGIWTITGPGNDPVLTSPDGVSALGLTGEIPAGSVLVIDTRPGMQDITLDGVNWWPHITDQMAMWPIPTGTSTATLSMTGATADSKISLTFTPQFWTPL